MASIKYRWQAIFDNLRLVSAHLAEQKEEEKNRNAPRKMQLNFICRLVIGQGKKEQVIEAETAELLDLYWKCKVPMRVYRELENQGLVIGSIADIRAAIDNYGANETGGTWFSFRELIKINGQLKNWSPTNESNELNNLENQINYELEEVA